MPYADIEKQRAARRQHYAKNREVYLARNAARKREFRRARDAAKAKPCADCGVRYPPYVMQFDHLKDKSFPVANVDRVTSLEKLLKEIAKCDVVCANCHAERTWGRSRPQV